MSWKTKAAVAFWLAVLTGWFVWQRRSDVPLEPIVIAGGAVMVRNQSPDDWRSVRIWVNDHYAGGANTIPAGGFVREPLSRFVAAQGQTLDPARTAVTSVVVLATAPDGARVRVVWGKPFLH